jgi:hypothetical protein
VGHPYATSLLCTRISRPPKAWIPAGPLPLPNPVADGDQYGLATTSLNKVSKRNYEPNVWRLEGDIFYSYTFLGYQTSPGPFDAELVIFDPSDPVPLAPHINVVSMPVENTDFTKFERIIAETGADPVIPIIGYHPICMVGSELRAVWAISTLKVRLRLDPYTWSRAGGYLLEHDVSVETGISYHTEPNLTSQEVFLDEGVGVGGGGSAYSRFPGAEFGAVIAGDVEVTDPIASDDDWGSVTLYSQAPPAPQILVDLALTCQNHIPPRPDL